MKNTWHVIAVQLPKKKKNLGCLQAGMTGLSSNVFDNVGDLFFGGGLPQEGGKQEKRIVGQEPANSCTKVDL